MIIKFISDLFFPAKKQKQKITKTYEVEPAKKWAGFAFVDQTFELDKFDGAIFKICSFNRCKFLGQPAKDIEFIYSSIHNCIFRDCTVYDPQKYSQSTGLDNKTISPKRLIVGAGMVVLTEAYIEETTFNGCFVITKK